jgi:WD40 repeat protein
MSRQVRSLVGVSLWAVLLAAALALPSAGPARDADSDKAERELQGLRKRLPEASTAASRANLRHDLLAFETNYPGALAPRAAALLRELPSPLDALNPATIPQLERFDWQPKELVAVLGEHRGRHGGPLASALFHPDGSMIASGGVNLVRLWDPATMRLIGLAGFGGSSVMSMAFNKDGSILAVGGSNGLISFYDLIKDRAPQPRFSVQACSSPVYSVAYHPDGKLLAAACHDNVIRFYDASGAKLRDVVQVNAHTAPVTAVAFSPDGKTFASGSQDDTIRLWSVTGEDVTERTVLDSGAKGSVLAMTFSPSSTNLSVAGNDGHVRIWTVPAGPKAPPKFVLPLKVGNINGLSYSSTGNTLALACDDKAVHLWTVTGTPRERGKLEGHAGTVTGVMYSPDKENRRLVSCSADWTVRTWDLTTTRPTERFIPRSHLSYIYSVACAPDGQSLVSGSLDTIVRVWDLARAEPRTRAFLKGEGSAVYSVAYSPDGKLVAAGGVATRVRQWDAQTGRDKPHLAPVPSPVYRVVYSPDAKRLLTQSQNDAILWDVARGRQLTHLGLGDIRVNGVAWAPDCKQVLTYHGNYKYQDGKIVRKKDGSPEYVDCILRLYEAAAGKELSATKDAEYPIACAAFSADGKTVFAGVSLEAQLRRFDVGPTALVPVEPWKGTASYPTEVIPAPDGETVIIRLGSGILAQHEVATGKRLRQWSFQENIAGCGYSSDSRYLAVGLATGVIYILQLTPPAAAK